MTLRRPRLVAAAAAVAAAGLPVLLLPPDAHAVTMAQGPECSSVTSDTKDGPPVTGENDANALLEVADASALARKAGTAPGDGVTVVVVDTPTAGFASRTPSGLESAHGRIVASIIAGPDQPKPPVSVGIAPGARIVDKPFYDAPRGEADDGVPVPMADALVRSLDDVVADRRSGSLKGRTIVVIPAEVSATAALEKAVDRLVDSGVLVIAASGDRPAESDGALFPSYVGAPKPGEDAVADVWPAADENVVSVGVAPGALDTVLRNSGVDLAAPGGHFVARALNGKWCVVTTVSSHWAAAQVAGVAALVWSVHRDDSAAELRKRLEGTASGNGAAASPLTGYGVVQPVEAIQRESEGMFAQGHDADAVPRAKVPRERADLLGDTREHAVWWGLGGGGALVILLVLRPVLARRR